MLRSVCETRDAPGAAVQYRLDAARLTRNLGARVQRAAGVLLASAEVAAGKQAEAASHFQAGSTRLDSVMAPSTGGAADSTSACARSDGSGASLAPSTHTSRLTPSEVAECWEEALESVCEFLAPCWRADLAAHVRYVHCRGAMRG
ncbi:MAG: hypothetical protein EOO41_05845 [Methanobacteriota archaeon]|nr:MAG: hypothetical protein EOO41_05845 [Euryarchaeota archaeon]